MKLDLKSWLTGYILGVCGKPLPLVAKKEPTAYRYNGIRTMTSCSTMTLLKLPEQYAHTGNWEVADCTCEVQISGDCIWTDGTNIYYDSARGHFILNGTTWENHTWNVDNIIGSGIWTDGENIYHSYDSSSAGTTLVLKNGVWETQTWGGVPPGSGSTVWTDGTNLYWSYVNERTRENNHYIFDKISSSWVKKTWYGLPTDWLIGNDVWSDGVDIYWSDGDRHYVLDLATSTWSEKVWGNGSISFGGSRIWTDGVNIYVNTYGSSQYVLNVATSTWSKVEWFTDADVSISLKLHGDYIWTDGADIYMYSYGGLYLKLTQRK